MKLLTTMLLSGCCLIASAQKRTHNNLSQHIHDDGKTMSIAIKGDSEGHTIDYNRTFSVSSMSKTEKDALTKHITDSLGIGSIQHPTKHQPPVGPPPTPTPVSNRNHDTQHVNSDIDDDGKTLHVKLSGTQNNRPFSYDHTFKVQGMTAKEKNALVKHITDSLGVTKNVQLSTN